MGGNRWNQAKQAGRHQLVCIIMSYFFYCRATSNRKRALDICIELAIVYWMEWSIGSSWIVNFRIKKTGFHRKPTKINIFSFTEICHANKYNKWYSRSKTKQGKCDEMQWNSHGSFRWKCQSTRSHINCIIKGIFSYNIFFFISQF